MKLNDFVRIALSHTHSIHTSKFPGLHSQGHRKMQMDFHGSWGIHNIKQACAATAMKGNKDKQKSNYGQDGTCVCQDLGRSPRAAKHIHR